MPSISARRRLYLASMSLASIIGTVPGLRPFNISPPRPPPRIPVLRPELPADTSIPSSAHSGHQAKLGKQVVLSHPVDHISRSDNLTVLVFELVIIQYADDVRLILVFENRLLPRSEGLKR